jgi:tetratricopeptide (TPR) repeat protein
MVFFSILLTAACFTGGCISPAEQSITAIKQPSALSNGPQVNFGGTALAIAFREDEISTTSPVAKERFLTGLTYLTRYAQYNESLVYFDAVLAIDQNFSEAWVAKAVALHNMKRFDEAITCYDRALALAPGDAAVWHLKGTTLHDYGKLEESEECYRRAAERDPRYGTR